MAVFDDVAPKDKLLLFSHRIDWIDRVPVPRKEDAEVIHFEMEEPLRIECRHFLECIENHTRARTDGEKGVRVLEVLDVCQRPLQEGGMAILVGEQLHSVEKLTRQDIFVHETACVDEPADIGDKTQVWDFSHIMPDAKIGESCIIGQNVFIASGAVLGKNVKVQNNVSIYHSVVLEDDIFCGPSMVFTNVFNPRSFISRKKEFRQTLIKRGATIGAVRHKRKHDKCKRAKRGFFDKD